MTSSDPLLKIDFSSVEELHAHVQIINKNNKKFSIQPLVDV